MPSWGNMLAGLQRYDVLSSYWWMFVPGVALIPVFLLYYGLADALHQRAAAFSAVTPLATLAQSWSASRIHEETTCRIGRRAEPAGRGVAMPGHAAQHAATLGQLADVEWLVSRADVGRSGGQLVVIERAEPRTLNPVIAIDSPSKDVIWRTMADLIHINRETQQTEPALARSWTVSPDGRRFTLVAAPRRSFLRWRSLRRRRCAVLVSGLPGREGGVAAAGSADRRRTADRRAEARSGDGSSRSGGAVRRRGAAVRQHRDASASPARDSPTRKVGWREAWALGTPAEAFAGLGPFRFKEHLPGQRIIARAQPVLLESGPRGQPPALSRPDRVHLRSERRRAGGAVPVGRGRHHDAFERREFRRPAAGSGQAELRAARPRSRTRLHLPLLQPEQSGGESGCRRLHESRRGFASCRSGRPCRSRSTAKASFVSSIEDGPRRSGVMSRRATSCG